MSNYTENAKHAEGNGRHGCQSPRTLLELERWKSDPEKGGVTVKIKLKRCPFCNKNAKITKELYGAIFIECKGTYTCRTFSGPWAKGSHEYGIKSWNRRVAG